MRIKTTVRPSGFTLLEIMIVDDILDYGAKGTGNRVFDDELIGWVFEP